MTTTKPTLAWLGAGLMGTPMIRRLLSENYSVTVWNRTRSRADALKEQGATVAATPDDAISSGDIVITMLTNAQVTEEALQGVNMAGKILLQMATLGPGENQRIAGQVALAGGQYLEAPVLGSIPEAQSGRLIIMAGGSEYLFEAVCPVLACLGPEPRWVGDVGQASALKLALNQLIASLTVAFSTSLGFVRENGVNVEIFMDILRQSALYAPTFDKKLAKMLDHHYQNPNFPTEHMLKDIQLFSQEARELDTQLLDLMRHLYGRAQAQHQREDYSCVYDVITGRC